MNLARILKTIVKLAKTWTLTILGFLLLENSMLAIFNNY